MKKKGQMDGVGGLPTFVMTLVLVGVLIGIGIFILATAGDIFKDDITAEGEQITSDNTSYVALTNVPIQSVSLVINASNGSDIISGSNYSFITTGILITDGRFNGQLVNVSYVGKEDSESSTAVDETIAAIGDIPTWLVIIVVVAMSAIVLALLMGAFGGRQR